MLKVTLHASTPRAATPQNLLGRIDIGYTTLDAIANYKAAMVLMGLGELAAVALEKYPRWSASLWDLVARVVCLSINRREAIWPANLPAARRGAFMQNLTAVVEHWPNGFDTRRARVGEAHISMCSSRCNYRATFEDDITGVMTSSVFRHTPAVLNPADLLARAYAWTTTETFELPERPTLYTPLPFADGLTSYVCLETVREPARTGCYRWLAKQGIELLELAGLRDCVSESHYVEFLRRAV